MSDERDGVPFDVSPDDGLAVRGWLHRPAVRVDDGLVLTHGAGSAADAPLLLALARVFTAEGLAVLRCDLPFRQARPHGPPSPHGAGRDREGLLHALQALGRIAPGRRFLGGHSYGGRQATILAAEHTACATALLLLSYPLHPPRRPGDVRTAPFPRLRTPALFVHGSRDPFGAPGELRAALALIPARTSLLVIEGAGHDLVPWHGARDAHDDVATQVVAAFRAFVG